MKKQEITITAKRDKKVEQFISSQVDRDLMDNLAEGILAYCIQKASKSADILSRRIFWLNIILVILGTLSLIVVGYSIILK